MTINSFSDITQQYDVTLDNCPCEGFTRWGHCQHNEVLKRAYARAKAATFADMRQQFDVRYKVVDDPFVVHSGNVIEWERDAERTAYLNYCVQLGI